MPATRELYDLQAIDLDLDRRNKRVAEIDEALSGPPPFAEMRERAAALEQQVSAIATRQAALDDAIRSLSERIQADESKLYSGAVNNPRELTSLQADIAQMRRQQSEHEEKLLAVIDDLRAARSSLNQAKATLSETETDWQAQQASMKQEHHELAAEVKELSGRRNAHAKSIPPTELATYEQVRRSHKGRAVARLRNGTCEACRIALPTRQASAVRTSAQPVRCPSCGLILIA